MTHRKITENTPWQQLTPGGTILASGNSREFKTGDWRTQQPVFHEDQCKQCLLCAPVCPDLSIPVVEGKRSGFEMDFCKGCGICAQVCPFKAIEMISEDTEKRGQDHGHQG